MAKDNFPVSVNLFLLLGLVIASFFVNAFNVEIFLWLNSIHSNLSDLFWISMTTLGDGLLLGIILGMFILVNPRITAFGLALLIAASISANLIKMIIPLSRPAEVLETIHFMGPVLRSGSFPSGHSAAAMATAVALVRFSESQILKFILVSFGLFVGLSRIFVGAHFPNDVVWGIIVALLVYEFLATYLWPPIEYYVPETPPYRNRFFQALVFVQIIVSLFCLVIYSRIYAEYPPAAIAISTGVLTFFLGAAFKSFRN
ncbi:MAG: phosphatase PAP2 family protein [Pseudomonadota bacterium]